MTKKMTKKKKKKMNLLYGQKTMLRGLRAPKKHGLLNEENITTGGFTVTEAAALMLQEMLLRLAYYGHQIHPDIDTVRTCFNFNSRRALFYNMVLFQNLDIAAVQEMSKEELA